MQAEMSADGSHVEPAPGGSGLRFRIPGTEAGDSAENQRGQARFSATDLGSGLCCSMAMSHVPAGESPAQITASHESKGARVELTSNLP